MLFLSLEMSSTKPPQEREDEFLFHVRQRQVFHNWMQKSACSSVWVYYDLLSFFWLMDIF